MAKKSWKACQVCGRPFCGGPDLFYCPDCAKVKKSDTVIRIRRCQDCGAEFSGGPRAKRCPDCAYAAKSKHRNGPAMRPVGSMDKCLICGKEYSVSSGRQKYCSPACQRKGVLEWQRERKKGYAKASGQDVKKQKRRMQSKKICVYCLRDFTSDRPTNLCSDYCRKEQAKITQCTADIRRGYNRNLRKYEEKRDEYRRKLKSDR